MTAPQKEGAKARGAYLDYLAMGEGRTVKGLHSEYVRRHADGETVPTTDYGRMRTWSSVFKWRERVEESQRERQRAEEKAELDRLAARRRQMRDKALDLSERLAAQAVQMLDWPIAESRVVRSDRGGAITILMPAKWTKADAARYADTAIKLAALATGAPTENVAVSGKIRVTEVVAEIPESVIREQYERDNRLGDSSDGNGDEDDGEEHEDGGETEAAADGRASRPVIA